MVENSEFTVALTLVVIVALEMVRILIELPYEKDRRGPIETIEYDVNLPIVEKLRPVFPGFSIISKESRFIFLFFMTEYLIASTLAIIFYNFNFSSTNSSPPAFVAIGAGLIVFLWLFLPIISIDKYDIIFSNNIRAASIDAHTIGTMALIAYLYVYFRYIFTVRGTMWPDSIVSELPMMLAFLPIFGLYFLKEEGFTQRLDAELAEIEKRNET